MHSCLFPLCSCNFESYQVSENAIDHFWILVSFVITTRFGSMMLKHAESYSGIILMRSSIIAELLSETNQTTIRHPGDRRHQCSKYQTAAQPSKELPNGECQFTVAMLMHCKPAHMGSKTHNQLQQQFQLDDHKAIFHHSNSKCW